MNITILDCQSLLQATEAMSIREGHDHRKIIIDYPKLLGEMADWKIRHFSRERDGDEKVVAIMSIDPKSEGQQRFVKLMQANNVIVDALPYQQNFVSLPAGKSLRDGEKPQVSLASHLTYVLGMLYQYEDPCVMIVSHCFELYWPLMELASRREEAKVGIAFFGSLMDFRWRQAGVLDGKSPICFLDLDKTSIANGSGMEKKFVHGKISWL